MYIAFFKRLPVKPKYKIGDSVKSISVVPFMMVITIIESEDSNVQYKCAWVEDELVFSEYFNESDLITLPLSRYY